MKITGQIGVIAVIAAVAGAAWVFRDHWLPGSSANSKTQTTAQQGVLVQVKQVRLGKVTERFEAVGTALSNESVTITSRTSGTVVKVNIAEGEKVKVGQVLVQLDDREMLAELDAQKALAVGAKLGHQRAAQLRESQNAPQARVDDLFAAWKAAEARVRVIEARLADLKIDAPFAGRVGLRRVSVGALIQPGAVITTLDDTDTIRLKMQVPETLLSSVQIGLEVEATATAYPKRVFKGKVTSIDSRVDQISRASELRADIPNSDGVLKPGMFLAFALSLRERESAMLIPEEAVVPEGTRHYVYVIRDGKAWKTEVKLGERQVGEVEVREGLTPGQDVVVAGVQKIRNALPVRIDAGKPSA